MVEVGDTDISLRLDTYAHAMPEARRGAVALAGDLLTERQTA